MFTNRFGFAAEHTRKFLDATIAVEFLYMRVGASVNFILADCKLVYGAACNLVQVRNRQYLVVHS